jgi:LPXTG-motif cell wall-anchored protein
LKELMLLAAMLAMMLVVAAPAVAQVSEEFGQEIEDTGNVGTNFSATGGGNSANQCAGGAIQFGQSGNTQNGQGGLQYTSTSDDIEAEGSSFGVTPTVSAECKQQIQQATAAGKAAPPPPPAPSPPPAASSKAAPSPAAPSKAASPPAPPKAGAEAKKELPKTGGGSAASLFGLGAGALLVGGGLLVRKIVQ